jgi:hypothetical protein
MRNHISIHLLCFCLLLAGCASKQIPDWESTGFKQLEIFRNSYLDGKERIAELHFQKAVEQMKRGGDLTMLSKAYLTKYAVRTALLEDMKGSDYLDIGTIDPDPENRNYFIFLKGNLSIVDEKLLARQYRPVVKAYIGGSQESIDQEIARMRDPLSRLIAIGIIVKKDRYDEATLQMAVNTASENSWRKTVLVYLDKLLSFYEAKNEKNKAEQLRLRIKLLKD